MPNAITHFLIAQDAALRLPRSYADMPTVAPEYYFIGSQGGDPLFFYKPLSKKESNFGKFVHRYRVYELFCAMRDYLNNVSGEELEKARAYCLGYITHYSTDVCFHPFVYNLIAQVKAKKSVHFQIENDWDVYFLRTRTGNEAEHYVFPFSPRKLAEEGVLFRLLSALAADLGRRELSENALRRAWKNYGRYLNFFHGNCYEKSARLSKFGKAFKNLARMYPRRTPANNVIEGEDFFRLSEGRGANADELFEHAVADSARRMILFLAALDGAPLPKEEFSFHLLTGKEAEQIPT